MPASLRDAVEIHGVCVCVCTYVVLSTCNETAVKVIEKQNQALSPML